jgi:hypothetical protein
VREGLRDVFGDCEEDFGEGEGCDLVGSQKVREVGGGGLELASFGALKGRRGR